MKKIVMIVIVAITVFAGTSCFAKDYNVGKICYVQSTHIYPCNKWYSVTGTHDYWIKWDSNRHDSDMMYQAAMAALLADKEIIVRIDPNQSSGWYDMTTIIRIKK